MMTRIPQVSRSCQISKSSRSNGFHTSGVLRLLTACRVLGLAHRKVDLPRDHITLELDLPEILIRAKRAYRALVRQHHVDHGGEAASHRAVVQAYHRVKTLCSPRVAQEKPKKEIVQPGIRAAVQAYWDNIGEAELAKRCRQVSEGMRRSREAQSINCQPSMNPQ